MKLCVSDIFFKINFIDNQKLKTSPSDQCCICLECKFDEFKLSCSHSFCRWCIASYVSEVEHPSCPFCRKKISETEELRKYLDLEYLYAPREPRISRPPLRFTTDGRYWSEY